MTSARPLPAQILPLSVFLGLAGLAGYTWWAASGGLVHEGNWIGVTRAGVIETSFAMDIGETVVVGTSRMRGGDKALIALLTAVPKGK